MLKKFTSKHTILFFSTVISIILFVPNQILAFNPPDYELDRFHFDEKINQNSIIQVNNPYGDVRIRPAPNNNLIIHAVYQKIGKNPAIPKMEVSRSDSKIKFDFVYPKDNIPERLQDGRIDIVVIVPESAYLDIKFERGKLQSKTLGNRVKVRTDLSDISIKTTSEVDLYTRAGKLELHLIKENKKNKATVNTLKTSNGNIDISYQLNTDVEFNITTTASITSNDVKLLSSKFSKTNKHKLSLGKPENKFNIFSDTGNVRVINREFITN